MAIRENLKALMDHRSHATGRKLTEYRLAAETGVPQPTIHRILTGESSDPKTETVRPLAAFFGVTVEDMRGTSSEIQIRESELSPEAMALAKTWQSLPATRRQAHKESIYLEAAAFRQVPGLKVVSRSFETTGQLVRRSKKS